jgi:DNA repair protein RecO (recombination protein O)
MSRRKSPALVLRVRNFSETSQIVTFFSRDFGKVTGLAKGAKRQIRSNAFGGPFDLLQHMEVLWIHRESGGLSVLTEASILTAWPGLRRDFNRLYAGTYLVQVVDRLTADDQPNPSLYALLRDSIAALAEADDYRAPMIRAEIRMLKMLGYYPRLTECALCGNPLPERGRIAFSPHAGGAACNRCRIHDRSRIGVTPEAIRYVEQFGRRDATPPTLSEEEHQEVRRILTALVSYHLEYVPRLLSYLT